MTWKEWWNNPCFWGHDFEEYERVPGVPNTKARVVCSRSTITGINEVCLRCGETRGNWHIVKEERLEVLRRRAEEKEMRRQAALLMVLANEAQKRGEYE